MSWNLSLNSQVVVETFDRGLDIPDPLERSSENLWLSPDGRYVLATADDGLTEINLVPNLYGTAGENLQRREAAGRSLTAATWKSAGGFFACGDALGKVRIGSRFLPDIQVEFRAHEDAPIP